jgi:succinyl-CoA:acetate CoA-transferase
MYTEVIQDSIFDLIDSGKLRFASTTALTFSKEGQIRFFEQLNELKSKFIIRPMEISNHPEVIRRIGLITMNTALEADIYGNVNSTHVLGSSMMNGIGGSGDFTRNAVIIFLILLSNIEIFSICQYLWLHQLQKVEKSPPLFQW